jgi:hypothetical protein
VQHGGTDAAVLAELPHDPVERLLLDALLDGHADVHLARADQVDDDAEPVQDAKDAREEPVRDALPVAVHVQHDDALLDRHRGRVLVLRGVRKRGHTAAVRELCDGLVRPPLRRGSSLVGRSARVNVRVRVDDCAAAIRVLDILDADRYLLADDLSSRAVSFLLSLGKAAVRTCSMVNGCTTSLP